MLAIPHQNPQTNNYYTADLSFVMICKNWAFGETNCNEVPALYVHCFSRHIICVS